MADETDAENIRGLIEALGGAEESQDSLFSAFDAEEKAPSQTGPPPEAKDGTAPLVPQVPESPAPADWSASGARRPPPGSEAVPRPEGLPRGQDPWSAGGAEGGAVGLTGGRTAGLGGNLTDFLKDRLKNIEKRLQEAQQKAVEAQVHLHEREKAQQQAQKEMEELLKSIRESQRSAEVDRQMKEFLNRAQARISELEEKLLEISGREYSRVEERMEKLEGKLQEIAQESAQAARLSIRSYLERAMRPLIDKFDAFQRRFKDVIPPSQTVKPDTVDIFEQKERLTTEIKDSFEKAKARIENSERGCLDNLD